MKGNSDGIKMSEQNDSPFCTPHEEAFWYLSISIHIKQVASAKIKVLSNSNCLLLNVSFNVVFTTQHNIYAA